MQLFSFLFLWISISLWINTSHVFQKLYDFRPLTHSFIPLPPLSLQSQWTSGVTGSQTAPAVQPTPTGASGAMTRSASLPPATVPLWVVQQGAPEHFWSSDQLLQTLRYCRTTYFYNWGYFGIVTVEIKWLFWFYLRIMLHLFMESTLLFSYCLHVAHCSQLHHGNRKDSALEVDFSQKLPDLF